MFSLPHSCTVPVLYGTVNTGALSVPEYRVVMVSIFGHHADAGRTSLPFHKLPKVERTPLHVRNRRAERSAAADEGALGGSLEQKSFTRRHRNGAPTHIRSTLSDMPSAPKPREELLCAH